MEKWISIKERLPEDDGDYLVTTDFGIKVLEFSNDLYKLDKYDFIEYYNEKKKRGFYIYDSEFGYCEIENIIAWMSLPEPYKED